MGWLQIAKKYLHVLHFGNSLNGKTLNHHFLQKQTVTKNASKGLKK